MPEEETNHKLEETHTLHKLAHKAHPFLNRLVNVFFFSSVIRYLIL